MCSSDESKNSGRNLFFHRLFTGFLLALHRLFTGCLLAFHWPGKANTNQSPEQSDSAQQHSAPQLIGEIIHQPPRGVFC
jgi:hypothetical protein